VRYFPRPESLRAALRSSRARATAAAAFTTAVLLVGVSAASGASASTVPADRWTTSSGNPGNAAIDAGETLLTQATAPHVAFRWKLGVDAGVGQHAPVIVNGVAYMTTDTTYSTGYTLLALSVKTGATLWRLPIPNYAAPGNGMAVTGDRLLISYGWHGPTYLNKPAPGGVIAVDLSTHRMVWRSPLPPQNGSSGAAGQPYTDGKQVYVTGAENAVVAFRLSDGKFLWRVAAPQSPRVVPPAIDGMAVSGGQVFVVDGDGLVVFDGLTGRRLWSSPTATAPPIVANGVVFTKSIFGIEAFSAAGCSTPTCNPVWSTKIAHLPTQDFVFLRSADSSSLFLTYYNPDGSNNGCYRTGYMALARLSARTGQLVWSARLGLGVGDVVHAGSLLWATEFIPAGPCDYPYERLIAVSATSTTAPKALVQIPVPEYDTAGQYLAVAGGTVIFKASATLRGARVKGQ
jgi:outer membrane protein assembly factor BamB